MGPPPRCRTLLARLLPRLLAALVAAPLLVVVTGGPASACSCAAQSLERSRAQADVVLAGEVLRRHTSGDEGSSTARATYVVQVDRVFKGKASAVQEVVTVVSGASCGLELPDSGPALLFARGTAELGGLEPAPGQLTATLCDGSRVGGQAPASFGSGYPPTPGVSATAPTEGAGGVGLAAAAALTGVVLIAGAVGRRGVRARRSRRA